MILAYHPGRGLPSSVFKSGFPWLEVSSTRSFLFEAASILAVPVAVNFGPLQE